jgi:hypothetical protein
MMEDSAEWPRRSRGLLPVPRDLRPREPRIYRGFTGRDFRRSSRHNQHMTSIVQKAIAEEHHLEEIARDGYAPATLPIVLGVIVLALIGIVGLALGITMAVYYLT